MLYLHHSYPTLALKLFRGEPAISGFDWNFSPIHKSSPPFSTDVWFGPPWSFTSTSTCSWIGHPVSGLRHATIALFRLAFASAPNLQFLTLLHNVTRRSVLQKVRDRALLALSLLVNTGFQVLFHSPPGVLFTFPSRYYALSVTISYLGLGGGPPGFPPDFSCPAVLWYRLAVFRFRVRVFHPLWRRFPTRFCYLTSMPLCRPATPESMLSGLASFPFARRYLGNRCFFLFLLLLRCFSSEGFLHMAMYLPCSDTVLPYRVSPFGYLRVYGYLLLTAAFRSLSRPSSAPDAKSFSLRSL